MLLGAIAIQPHYSCLLARIAILLSFTSCFRNVRLTHIVFEFLTSRSVLDFSIKPGASGPAGSRMYRACVEIAPISPPASSVGSFSLQRARRWVGASRALRVVTECQKK